MEQPLGYEDVSRPNYVCKLNKALYGLKQAPRTWFERFSHFLLHLGFKSSPADSSMFTYHHGSQTLILLLYVDHILLTGTFTSLISHPMKLLLGEFAMKDLAGIHYFFGVEVIKNSAGLFLSQAKYIADLLDHTNMKECKLASTPMAPKLKLSTQGVPFSNPFLYRSIVGGLAICNSHKPGLVLLREFGLSIYAITY